MTNNKRTIVIHRNLVQVKRLYLAADDHTDYMWTADEATYRRAFVDMLDYYLDAADAHLDNPPDLQVRWNCDGSLWLWEYEHHKPAAAFERLIDRVRSGHISVPLNTLVSCYGGMPAEAVLRGMYHAGKLERRYNLRFTLALAMENQTLPYGLGALWAGAGAKYSWRGICHCATRIDARARDHELYWWAGPDGSHILMKWYSTIDNQDLGGYAEARVPATAVSHLDTKCGQPSYPFDVAAAFGQGWDDLQTTNLAVLNAAQAGRNASRRLIVSNEQDFFEDVEATYGASLPSLACTFGNEWELLCASMAEVSARVKRAVEKLRAAEAMMTLVTLHIPSCMDTRRAARDRTWINLGLYWEHCWSAGPGVSTEQRAAWQRRIAGEIEAYIEALHDDAANALAGLIQSTGNNLRFYVFNPLSWVRTDIADLPYTGPTPVRVVDLTANAQVPSQVISLDGQVYLRILASDVPSTGYKVYEVRTGAGQAITDGPTADAATGRLENSFYQLTIAGRGAITSLVDKLRTGRQFARIIGGAVINDLGPGDGALSIENAGPVSVTLKAISDAPLSHTTRVTLIRNLNRIDIRNEITQNFGDVRAWRFGFDLDTPDVWHEEVGAIIRARLLAEGGHYAPRTARYDWLTLNHFADISSGGAGVTLSNADCYFMQLGASSVTVLDTTTPQLSPLAGGQVDGPGFGIPNQGGDTHFLHRFALQTHDAFDPAAAMRFGLEHQNPLVARAISGDATSPYPGTSFSLLALPNPQVLLWSLKPAEDGAAVVARVWNLSNSPQEFTLSAPGAALHSATHVTHVETPVANVPLANGALTAVLNAQQLKTFALAITPLGQRAP